MDNKTMLDEAKNLVDLGNMYYMGEGVERNYKKAKKYYEQAKRKNSIVALYKLGFMYENGKGVSKSYQKAKVYYEQALTSLRLRYTAHGHLDSCTPSSNINFV